MTEILAAFQFLTVFPQIIKRPFTASEMGRSVGVYPVVGLALGGLLLGVYHLAGSIFPPLVVSWIVTAVWIMATRALHIDGFMDTCDGLFGGFTTEKRLSIMRDSRVGAFGVVGGVLLLIGKVVLVFSLSSQIVGLLLAPVLGRWAITYAIVGYPYVRETGMGGEIKDNAGWPQLLLATLVALITVFLAASWSGLVVFLGVLAVGSIWFWYVQRLIPGMTGDIYGATCEMIEVFVLVAFAQILL